MNKMLLFGTSFLFIFVLLAGCVAVEDENGLNETDEVEIDFTEKAEFEVKEETIEDIKLILEDLIYLNTGMKGQVNYISGEMDGNYKVLTFIVNNQEVQEIYVTEDEKSILQGPPISIGEMKTELAYAKIEMEEYFRQMEDFEQEPVIPIDPLEGTNMTVQECLENNGIDGYIFLYSTSCPHCVNMIPVIDELISEGYNIHKTTDSRSLSGCLKDMSGYVPEFICNVDGSVHLGGGLSKDELIELYTNCGTQ